ncbi:MAG TPA: type ISP restriction/modification enzyme, partial [Chitinophagaceae bacterium]|nr:type ISP restriction/modification enzyme [Chitinophagaceae bacterium]
ETLLPLVDKSVKAGKSKKAIFQLFSLGVVTNRDEWVYDNNTDDLISKVEFLIDVYSKDLAKHKGKEKKEIKDLIDYSIKWTRAVKNDIAKGKEYIIDASLIIDCLYRPFHKKHLYYNKELNEMRYQMPYIFPETKESNLLIAVNQSTKPFNILASKYLVDLHFNGDSNCIPLYRYDKDGNRQDNITDWGQNQFTKQYKTKKITKEDIFHYVYAVLHYPAYRAKYELNLKREFPRIPFYEDFKKWAAWGRALMELHINYESVTPYPLKEITKAANESPKAKLKANKVAGTIEIDENITITGVPVEVWEYKLGNRSAIEWILDQYKEGKPKDPTIAEKFNTYRFADYKEQVIDLLKRVCTVSVETMKIINEMNDTKE